MKFKVFPPLIASSILMLAILACSFGSVPSGTQVPEPATAESEAQVTATPNAPLAESTGACTNPYLPIVVGATWEYKLTGAVADTFTRSILSTEAGGFTDQDVFATGVTRQGKWTCENGALTALDPANGNSASVNSENVTVDFQTTAASGVTLPASPAPGDTWTQTTTLEGTETINGQQIPAKNEFSNPCTAIGMESVTVAAGTFNALRVDCVTNMNITITMSNTPIQNAITFNATSWYAEGVGLVKITATGSGFDSVTELTAYHIP